MNKIILKLEKGRKNNATTEYLILYQKEYERTASKLNSLKTLVEDLEKLDIEIKQDKVKVKWNRDENGAIYCSYRFDNKNSVQGYFNKAFKYEERHNK